MSTAAVSKCRTISSVASEQNKKPLFSSVAATLFLISLSSTPRRRRRRRQHESIRQSSTNPSSYRERKCDSDFSGGGYEGSGRSSSAKRELESSPKKTDLLDGLTHVEKNFYKESASVASMTEAAVEEYRKRRQITVEGRDIPKPVREFRDIGFPAVASMKDHGLKPW